MKLRTKFAVVLLLITVVLSGSVYGGLELYKDRIVEQNREDVEETAALSAGQLDATIEDRKDFVGFVASRPEASRFDRSDPFLRQFVDNSRFFGAQIVAANGTIVDFYGDVTRDVQEESIGSDVGDRPYVARALGGEVYVSEPEYVNATDEYLVIFSAPIFEDRELRGVLAAAIYLDEQTFFGVLAPISRGDQHVTVTAGSATLYRSGGRVDDAIQSSSTVESTGWTVTVDRDRASLLDRLRELAIAQGIGILLIMLSVVSFGVWEYRSTLAQTEKLLAGFEALQRGEFDHELSLAAAEEWEQIGGGFNALASGLASREAAIRQREQRLDVLNRVLRHNLRNDAAIVLGYAELIRSRSADEEVLDGVERIEATGSDLEALSEKARQLEFTMEERPGPFRLNATDLVADVLATIRREYPAVAVRASMPESAPVSADISLRLALLNVCENACEHNDAEEPRLDVAVERTEDAVTIDVTDNGDGIPEHEWAVLDSGEETPLEHGSGLGLWVAQWAVQRSGGTLRFSTNDPAGTTVTIELVAPETDDVDEAEVSATVDASVEPEEAVTGEPSTWRRREESDAGDGVPGMDWNWLGDRDEYSDG